MALAKKGINKPWCFNRKEEKGHGDKGVFVGAPVQDGARVLMLDDVFTTGGAKEEAIAQLSSAAKVSIAGIFILVDRQEKGADGKNAIAEFEKKHSTKVHALLSADEIFDYLSKSQVNGKMVLTEEVLSSYREYRKQYGV
jgi:orotate phosphoribosyltransferase